MSRTIILGKVKAEDAKINGYNVITLSGGSHIVLNQDESDFSIGISDVGDAGGIAALDEQGNVVANNIPAAPNDDGKYNLQAEVETVDSEKTVTYNWNTNSGPVSVDFNDITNKPTTLSGYGITDALPKTNPIADGYFVLNPGTHETTEFAQYSTTEGRGSLAEGEASHAEGISTLAQGAASHTEGQTTKAEGSCSHAEGGATIAAGDYSHAEGNSTVTNNLYEHAQGHFNKSHKGSTIYGDAGNTIHSIGIGTNLQNRKNALEVMQNGDIYALGIGEYDGVDTEAASTVQAMVSSINTALAGKSPIDHTHTPDEVGLGNVGNFKAVSTVANQELTDTEKANARSNIGAGSSSFSGSYNDLTDKPDIPDSLSDLSTDTTHRVVTDTQINTWNAKSDFDGDYNSLTNKPTIPVITDTYSSTSTDGMSGIAVAEAILTVDTSSKMDKENPTGTGSLSLNRKADTTVGDYSIAVGYNTTASGEYSFTEGNSTVAASASQHVSGKYNVVDNNDTYAVIVGNGTADDDRSNAMTVDWDGNITAVKYNNYTLAAACEKGVDDTTGGTSGSQNLITSNAVYQALNDLDFGDEDEE